MSEWKIEYIDKAFTTLETLNRPTRRQIIDRLEWFADNFDILTPAPLHGEWKDFFKFRINDWRIIYYFDSSRKLIYVSHIDRRDKVYKKRR